MRALALLFVVVFSSVTQARLSPEERAEVTRRLHEFYARPMDPAVMWRRIPKYDVARQGWAARDAWREGLARHKTEARFRFFPGLRARADIMADDRVEDLAETWIAPERIVRTPDAMPVKGATQRDLWSDDYWRVRWGITSYRYADHDDGRPKGYYDTIGLYAQPDAWRGVVGLPILEIARRILRWSPSEKYDLTVGDVDFTLTREQKGEGESHVEGGDVAAWMGICHGWAAASVMDPKPVRAVTVTGANGARVEWYPNDIRAMASLAWANGGFGSTYIGGRCDVKDVKTYPNGRVKQQKCFDTNPATFHLALTNLVGREKQTFIIDSSFDYEVWNQPIKNYELTYFNPLSPDDRSETWSEVAVDYDAKFKAIDRFQHPDTRGRGIAKIVGVIAEVEYMSENTPPPFGPAPQPDITRRVTYTYDLELYQVAGQYQARGGEWQSNEHPDFMWLPKQNAHAIGDVDYESFVYSGTATPALAALAGHASAAAQPLCRVVQALFKQSSGKDGYRCPP